LKKITLQTEIEVFENLFELPKKDALLMQAALKSMESAYAPYSNFKVGAALLLDNGEIVSGNNQENAAYPSGLCAERVAIFYAGAKYPNQKILKMAIAASSDSKPTHVPVPPCGACRQSVLEYETKQKQKIEILFMGKEGSVAKAAGMIDLLPLGFDSTFLS